MEKRDLEFSNYYKTYTVKEIDLIQSFKIYEKNLYRYIKDRPKDCLILEIGCGKGKIAKFLFEKGYKNYIGLDLDSSVIDLNLDYFKNHPCNYNFLSIDAIEYLKIKKDKFDIIIMSHVFEHFNIVDAKKISNLILISLKEGGIWINIMPNAQSLFYSNYMRYGDITHKIIYTPDSFNQILLESGFNPNNIYHYNEYIGYNFIKRFLHLLFLNLYKIFLLLLGFEFKNIYTLSFISVIKN